MSKTRTRRLRAILVTLVAVAATGTLLAAGGARGAESPQLPQPPVARHAVKLSSSKTAALAKQLRSNGVRTNTAYSVKNVCAAAKLACRASVLADANHNEITSDLPVGWGASELRRAYGATDLGRRPVVAVFTAGDGANAVADVAHYREVQGLPACSDCVEQVPYSGPAYSNLFDWFQDTKTVDDYWFYQEAIGQETTLDAEMVTATCPACQIKIVQVPLDAAFSPGYDPSAYLMTPEQLTQYIGYSVSTAQALGASALSFSWGWDVNGAAGSTTNFIKSLKTPGMSIVVSSGDNGNENLLNAQFDEDQVLDLPGSAPNVIAAGGTSLYANAATGGFSEVAWSGAGSSCVAQMPPAAGQPRSVSDLCAGHRATSDVSAVADPMTGVAVFDSYSPYFGSDPSWSVFGGTSVSAPLIAGLIASSSWPNWSVSGPAKLYSAPPGALTDITVGANALPRQCGGSPLCFSGPGWDGPTGVGTPSNAYATFNGPLLLRNVGSGKCLDLGDGSHASVGTIVECPNTKTKVTPMFKGRLSSQPGAGDAVPVTVAGANTCVDSADESTANGAPVVAGRCTGHNSQKWTFAQTAPGSTMFVIRNLQSQRCVDVAYHRAAVGTPVTQGVCTASRFQQWELAQYAGS